MFKPARQLAIGVAAGGFLLLASTAVTFAHGGDDGHGAGATTFDGDLLGWAVLSLGGVVAALVACRVLFLKLDAAGGKGRLGALGFLTAVRGFSRNARLFLAYSLLAELGAGVWAVLFNLYLLRSGFALTFIGTFWLVNMLCHASAALPAGVIGDRFGRRRSFFIAMGISLTAQACLLFTTAPALILALAGVAGFGEAFHGVTGPPFMMENSEDKERPHLFSLNAAFLQVSRFAGSLAGGVLPLVWAATLGLPAVDPAAGRWALVTGLPCAALALLPLAFMRERPVEAPGSLADIVRLRNVVNFGIIARFTALSLLVGTGFGLTARFFNLFFASDYGASDAQIGTVLGFAAFASAAAVLIAPALAQRWGMARSLWLTQSLSVPLLLSLAVLPVLPGATAIFLARAALNSIGTPLRNQLTMELVESRERGTAAGFVHAAFDLGGGLGAGLTGLLIVDGDFTATFIAAAILIAVPAYLYYDFFDSLESKLQRPLAVVPGMAGIIRTGEAYR